MLCADLPPDHGTGVLPGPPSHPVSYRAVAQEQPECVRQRADVVERGQHPAAVSQQLLRVLIRRGDDRLPRRQGVGQGARDGLLGGSVRCHEDVAGQQPVHQIGLVDIGIDESDVVLEVELSDALLQHRPVGLAMPPANLGVRGADDDEGRLRHGRDDPGHGLDDQLEALVRAEQPEAEDHGPSGQVEPVLDPSRVDEGQVGHAVRHDRDARHGDAVSLDHHLPTALREHHEGG